jgi:hypothetical protein
MKHILFVAFIACLASCKKDTEIKTPTIPMMYKDLSSRVVNITTPAGIDINGDGPSDVWFEIFHTGDDIQEKDEHLFRVTQGEESKLLVNEQEESPIISKGDVIKINGNAGYEWEANANIELAKRTLYRNAAAPTWEGVWKNAQRKYLAVQVNKNGSLFNGWIELSFDTATEKVILHRSGFSLEAGADILAGQ